MCKKSFIIGMVLMALAMMSANPVAWAKGELIPGSDLVVSTGQIPLYLNPDDSKEARSYLYSGMSFELGEKALQGDQLWLRVGSSSLWVPAKENLKPADEVFESGIVDLYGILQRSHRYAVKMVKRPGAGGTLETYEKTESGYLLRHTYELSYRKEGKKERFGDLKSPGGPVVRYLYRTTKSSMNGWSDGKSFGVYKVSYPMPHDALPYLLSGKMTLAQYANIPAINEINGIFYPHPHSMLGADIVLHTKRWGSAGCFNVPNDDMAFLYHEDLVTENDKELIPLVIYDEEVEAPPAGQLF